MTKRADNKFERKVRDFYPTPCEAVTPLIRHLNSGDTYVEPFAGAGDLVDHLSLHGILCLHASDIEPQKDYIIKEDFNEYFKKNYVNRVITNPPWNRDIIETLLDYTTSQDIDTWLLLSADIAHNVWMAKYMRYCKMIVSIGRVKWIPDSKSSGFDNCCWYNFGNKKCDTIFVGREIKDERK
jgi:hypothetical protein